MPIEFRCSACDKLLRVPDDAAGKQAKCPECGEIIDVPPPDSPAAPPPAADQFAPSGGPWSSGPAAQKPAPGGPDDTNPFASPSMPGQDVASMRDDDDQYRTGPPWERDGPSVESFIATVKLIFSSTNYMFDTMRRHGGLGPPIFYALVGGMIGSVANQVYELILPQQNGLGFGGQPFNNPMMPGGATEFVFMVLLAPIGILIGLFVAAGIYHLMLMILGEGDRPFETTFRVEAYVTGATHLLLLIPSCGIYISTVVYLVLMIIGLSRAHRISGGKASAVVLIPFAVCCGLIVIALAMIFPVLMFRGPM